MCRAVRGDGPYVVDVVGGQALLEDLVDHFHLLARALGRGQAREEGQVHQGQHRRQQHLLEAIGISQA